MGNSIDKENEGWCFCTSYPDLIILRIVTAKHIDAFNSRKTLQVLTKAFLNGQVDSKMSFYGLLFQKKLVPITEGAKVYRQIPMKKYFHKNIYVLYQIQYFFNLSFSRLHSFHLRFLKK